MAKGILEERAEFLKKQKAKSQGLGELRRAEGMSGNVNEGMRQVQMEKSGVSKNSSGASADQLQAAASLLSQSQGAGSGNAKVDVATGALSGAAAGSAFGPVGAGVGAAVGGAMGILQAKAARKKAEQQEKARIAQGLATIEQSKEMKIQNALSGLKQTFAQSLLRSTPSFRI